MKASVSELNITCCEAGLNTSIRAKATYMERSTAGRDRLRSILRKRRGGGRAGAAIKRWPNDYFHAQGLISLSQAASDPSISVRVTHQLESRMRESARPVRREGAVLSRPYLHQTHTIESRGGTV